MNQQPTPPVPQNAGWLSANGNSQMAPVSQKKHSKALLWGVIGGIVALILILVAAIFAFIAWYTPTKKDFQAVQSYISATNKEISDVTIDKSTAESYKAGINKRISIIDKQVKAVLSSKALHDDDLKKSYQTYVDKWTAERNFYIQTEDAQGAYYEMAANCKTISLGLGYYNLTEDQMKSKYSQAMAPCMKVLDKFSSSSNEKTQKYAKSVKEYYASYLTYYVSYANVLKGNGSIFSLPKKPTFPSYSILVDMTKYTSISKAAADAYDNFNNLLSKKISQS